MVCVCFMVCFFLFAQYMPFERLTTSESYHTCFPAGLVPSALFRFPNSHFTQSNHLFQI